MSLLDNMINGNGKNSGRHSDKTINRKTARATGLGDPDQSGTSFKEEFSRDIAVDRDHNEIETSRDKETAIYGDIGDTEFANEFADENSVKKDVDVKEAPVRHDNGTFYNDRSLKRKDDTFKEEFSGEVGSHALYSDKTLKRGKSGASFKEEFSEGFSDVSRYGIQSYSKAGVTFEKLSENQAKINYSGLLARSGASNIEGVYGFGSNQNWEAVSTMTLNKENDGSFIAVIPVEQGKNVNFAFKDTAENWDNNSGMNYTFVN